MTRKNGKIIADLICLIDEEYDTDQPLLLFDPKETWKKTLLAPRHLHHARNDDSGILKKENVYMNPRR